MNSPDNVCPFTFLANPCDAERLTRAAAHLDAVDLGEGQWAHYADETDRWYVVDADDLAVLCDYLDDEDEHIARDAYSHWCAGTFSTEQPEGWTPDAHTAPPAPHWTNNEALYGACQAGIQAAEAFATPAEAWAGIQDPTFLLWAISNIPGAETPNALQSLRLALAAARAVEHMHDDPRIIERLDLIDQWLADPDSVAAAQLSVAESEVLEISRALQCLERDLVNDFHTASRDGDDDAQRVGITAEYAEAQSKYKAAFAAVCPLSAAVGIARNGEPYDCYGTATDAFSEAEFAIEYARDAVTPRTSAPAAFSEWLDAADVQDDPVAEGALADLVREHLNQPELPDYDEAYDY